MDRHPFQWDNPQHAELSEDLDALVDPETQRIMDEADLLEFVSCPVHICSSQVLHSSKMLSTGS